MEDPFRQLVINEEEDGTNHSELIALAEAAAHAAVTVSLLMLSNKHFNNVSTLLLNWPLLWLSVTYFLVYYFFNFSVNS